MMQNKGAGSMQVIGITGGIGSGKSEVLHFLSRQQGVKLVEADRLAHRLMEPGEEIFLSVLEAFGKEILSPEGSVTRKVRVSASGASGI